MHICIAQINYCGRHIQTHVGRIKEIIARNRHADLLVFPELILHGHPSFEKPEGFLYRRMQVVYRTISEDLYRYVRQQDARVIIGEIKRRGTRFYNLATYVDRHEVQHYTKTHVHWTEQFVPGRELKVFETPMGKLGINICFDAAFPEVWRVLALRGAEIIVNISAVPRDFPMDYMWRRLKGAALNNQVYCIYANRPGPTFSGYSAVFTPRGEVLAGTARDEAIFGTDIDPGAVSRWRAEEQIFPHRRPLLYRDIGRRQPETAEPGGEAEDIPDNSHQLRQVTETGIGNR
ncbi:MAG: carbon-nitrogen hydrolase family protein [Deltaproteobacteria bacterium]|nr:carbon-nitrogen hydrolase family protein [Candidatus Anaeroferrophillacea bacterium]